MKVPAVTVPSVSAAVLSLVNTPLIFVGGKIFAAKQQWLTLSKDTWLFDVVHGRVIELTDFPSQSFLPRPLSLSSADRLALDTALVQLLSQKVVESCDPSDGQGFFSNVFPTLKKDGTARIILNLRELNDFVSHVHFKMDTLHDVIPLIQHNSFFCTIDLKDAYFSVYVHPDERKWLWFL